MNKIVKNILIYAGIVLLFVVLAYSFVPQVLSGKVVNQNDITGFNSMNQESMSYNIAHPEDTPRWTGSMFSGMPNTAFRPSAKGDLTQPLYDLLFMGKIPANWLFVSLLGAFLLLLVLGVDKLLAIGGAVAVTFCSYNFQIIFVGHNTKMQAIALFPWVLAAVLFTYKSALKEGSGWKKWLPSTVLGAALFGLALDFQIKANHQQITYYLALVLAIYVIAQFIIVLVDKDRRVKIGRFFAASALLLVLGLVGIGTNIIKLGPLYQYTQYTMRGGSELSHPTGGQINSEGLQLDYATQWSYGWEELPNLMIPDFNGGSSAANVNPDRSALVALLKSLGEKNVNQAAKSIPMYWGPQPFTAGPMYMGAITIFLFLLGLFLYKGKDKWWIFAATVLAVLLALGSNLMWFTKLFFDYMPMYNKFRTVSMSLVILQITLPALGFLVLDRVLKNEYSKKEFLDASWVALALTAGFCLVCVVFPGVAGSFTGASDATFPDNMRAALMIDRRHALIMDALWSLILIGLTFALILWAYSVPKNAKETYATDPHIGNARRTESVILICVLVFANMFIVGKRYLNADDFVTPRQFKSHFNQREVDKMILEDKSPSYRVLDISVDMFNDNYNSYWHKNIGGYSPAKLQRYQDLIDRYIVDEIKAIYPSVAKAKTFIQLQASFPKLKVLSALNLKYLIVAEDLPPVINYNAYGNAWFVDSFVDAPTPDDEISLIETVDLRSQAIIGADFKDAIQAFAPATGNQGEAEEQQEAEKPKPDTIEMTFYSPNELHYHYKASADRPVVFSEVYYPKGWHAVLDPVFEPGGESASKRFSGGTDVDIYRTDWILRGAILPAGEHNLVMRFDPQVYIVCERLSRASCVLLFLLIAGTLAGMWVWRKKETE